MTIPSAEAGRITAETVVLAYRLLLGREPENAEVVNDLAHAVHSAAQLRKVFLASPEFRNLMAQHLDRPDAVQLRHPFHLPAIPVEADVTDELLARMLARIQSQWEQLGSSDPYWSVITQPQFRQDQFEAHRQQFQLSGKHSCELFLAALRRNGISPDSLQTCLEVGCGVGRVTRYLAQAAQQVVGCDISSQHLALARQYLDSEAVSNVELRHWSGIDALEQLPAFDALFSVITLQHNPPPVMAWMLRRLLGGLASGGVAYFQLPTYRSGYLFEAERYLSTPALPTLEMHVLPQAQVFRIVQESGCDCLEVREDSMCGDEDRMLSNTFLLRKR